MDLVPYNWEDFVEMPRDRLRLEVVDVELVLRFGLTFAI